MLIASKCAMVRYFMLYFNKIDVLSGFSVASAIIWFSASPLEMWSWVKSEHLLLKINVPVHHPVFLDL